MPQQIDELTPIANYMVREMTHNLWAPPAVRIPVVKEHGKQRVARPR
jgi:hypothetical protein